MSGITDGNILNKKRFSEGISAKFMGSSAAKGSLCMVKNMKDMAKFPLSFILFNEL